MIPETGWGLPSTGLLFGAACQFWNSIGRILAAAVMPLGMV